MKKFMPFLISGILMFSVSCLNEPYEEILDTADSDVISGSDSITDEPADNSNSATDNNGQTGSDEDNSTDKPDSEQGNDDTSVDNETPDDDTAKTECGNGKVETGEICDKNTIACSELDASFTGGTATCQDGCRGWNVDNCEGGNTVTPLAEMPAVTNMFELDYLYASAYDFDQGLNQNNELWNAALFSASIPLTSGSYVIPHPQTDAHWLSGFIESGTLQFSQYSYQQSSGSLGMPMVIFGLYQSDAVPNNELSIGIKDDKEVNFLVIDSMDGGSTTCIMLVGYGTLTVKTANMTQGVSGRFGFVTSKIGLYLPSQTPEGNVISDIQTAGYTICQ